METMDQEPLIPQTGSEEPEPGPSQSWVGPTPGVVTDIPQGPPPVYSQPPVGPTPGVVTNIPQGPPPVYSQPPVGPTPGVANKQTHVPQGPPPVYNQPGGYPPPPTGYTTQSPPVVHHGYGTIQSIATHTVLVTEPVPSLDGYMCLACFVLWCCNLPFGLAAFIVASVGGGSRTREEALRFGKISLSLSIIGIIMSAILTVVVLAVILPQINDDNNYN